MTSSIPNPRCRFKTTSTLTFSMSHGQLYSPLVSGQQKVMEHKRAELPTSMQISNPQSNTRLPIRQKRPLRRKLSSAWSPVLHLRGGPPIRGSEET